MSIPEKDSALQRKSAKDLVYETLCDWIIRSEMMPGEKLLDAELVACFNVSRTPVREAPQMLETQRLIKVTPSRTTAVAGADKNDIEKHYRPLAEIQGLAARLAVPRLTEAQLACMEEIQMGFEGACRADRAEKAIHCDNEFREVILRAVDNEYVMEFSHMLLLHTQRIKYHCFRRDMLRKTSVKHHRGILKALYDRDAGLAAKLVRSY